MLNTSATSCLILALMLGACPDDTPTPTPPDTRSDVPASDGLTDAQSEPDGLDVEALGSDSGAETSTDAALLDADASEIPPVDTVNGDTLEDHGGPLDDGLDVEGDGDSPDANDDADAGPPAPPSCGLWPLITTDDPGPGDADFPYGFASGAVRNHSAVVVVPTAGPEMVRVHFSYGPDCAAETTEWYPTAADAGFVAHLALTDLYPHHVYRYAVEMQDGLGLTSYAWLVTPPVGDEAVRLAFSGDIGTSSSYMEIYDEIITTGAEVLLSLGDWPYADLNGAAGTLEEFRDKHRSHRGAIGIRDMMRFLPVHSVWDDHEVTNDWDGDDALDDGPKVAAGMQAWNEFFPTVDAPTGEIYRRHDWGPNIDIFWLDLRSHRDANAAPNDANKTMLGGAQFQWLAEALTASKAAFKLIMTSVPLDYGTTGNDHWPGFAHERDLLVSHIVDEGIDGVLFLTADQHWLAVHHFQHGLKEFQVGPLAQFLRTPDANVPPWVLIQEPIRNYGLLDYLPATDSAPAQLTFTAYADEGELLWSETILAGRGDIIVQTGSPLTSWQITGAHTFYGAGPAEIDYAVPGDYTIHWVSSVAGAAVPPDETLTLVDGGTLTFSDGSSPAPAPIFADDFDDGVIGPQWQAVDQGVSEPLSDWHPYAGAAAETGNCYDYQAGEEVAAKLGTFLWNDSAIFGEGTFLAHLYMGDNDSMGLMYGIQGTDTYYRASVDIQRSYARLVRVDGGLFTVLDEDLSYTPPANSWYTLAVERSGDNHTVYLDGAPVLSATDGAHGSGSIALYCYGMDDGRFDNVALYP